MAVIKLKDNFDAINQDLSKACKSQFFSGIMMPLMQFVKFRICLVCIVGTVPHNNGDITIRTLWPSWLCRIFITNWSNGPRNYPIAIGQCCYGACLWILRREEMEDEFKKTSIGNTRRPCHLWACAFSYSPDKTIIHDFTAEAQTWAKSSHWSNEQVRLPWSWCVFTTFKLVKITIGGVDTMAMSRQEVHDAFFDGLTRYLAL